MQEEAKKKAVSPEKLAANRRNAQRSTVPRTNEGKQRASENSYKHGFFSDRLFPTQRLVEQDWPDYKRLLSIYWNHYELVGGLEKTCVEMIAFDSLRLAGVLGHETTVFDWGAPFEGRSLNGIVRYETNVRRQIAKDIERLERLQEQRRAEQDELELDPGCGKVPNTAAEEAGEIPEIPDGRALEAQEGLPNEEAIV